MVLSAASFLSAPELNSARYLKNYDHTKSVSKITRQSDRAHGSIYEKKPHVRLSNDAILTSV
jgi:hypothetical protein